MKLWLILMAVLCPAIGVAGENSEYTWKKLRSASELVGLSSTYMIGTHDQKRGLVYSMDLSSTEKTVYELDMATCVQKRIETAGSLPARIDMVTYDPVGRRLFCGRAGRDALYVLELDGDRMWRQYADGSTDQESYGAVTFWNPITQRPSYFGGYGFYRMKNWIWEADPSGWINVIPDNESCEPPRRTGGSMYALGNPDSAEVFIYSGEGSCSGRQYEPCANGIEWSDNGNGYCWLRDIWRYDMRTQTFTNILPPASSGYKVEGVMSFDYDNRRFVMIPLVIPPWKNDPNATSMALDTIYEVDQLSGQFVAKVTTGETPPQKLFSELGQIISYYDAPRDRVILIRKDGIWALGGKQKDTLCSDMRLIESQAINVRLNSSWESEILEPGRTYILKGEGEWSAANAPNSDEDFCYTYALPCNENSYARMSWIRVGYNIDSMLQGKGLLDPIEDGVDCATHTYHYVIKGNGQRLIVDFRDMPLSDNSGKLAFSFYECTGCSSDITSDSILGYRKVETHQVVTYALRNNPDQKYQWIATGGYLLGPSTNHYCDVIWGYDKHGSVCCIVSDSTCIDTVCVTTNIDGAATSGVTGQEGEQPTMLVKPNPASDMIDISTALGDPASFFELVDVTGNVVQRVEGAVARMSVANVAQGVYHIVQRDVLGNVIGMQRVVIKR